MKLRLRYIFSILIFVMLVSVLNTTEVNAMNTGFQTVPFPAEKKETFIFNSNILLLTEEPEQKTITCFDVNRNGLIAVGQYSMTWGRRTICIYSSEGVFQYGYTFDCSGSFYVEWDGENLNVYNVRSSVIFSLTSSGEIIEAFEVKDTVEDSIYINDFCLATQKMVDDTTYLVRNDIGILKWIAPSYSQIVVKDSSGAESIIYDVGSIQLLNMIATITIVFLFVFGVIAVVAWEFIKLRRGN